MAGLSTAAASVLGADDPASMIKTAYHVLKEELAQGVCELPRTS